MLLYNLLIFTDGDANTFLAGVARVNGYIKKVRASVLLLPLVVLGCSPCLPKGDADLAGAARNPQILTRLSARYAEVDVVLGADGIKSAVRDFVLGGGGATCTVGGTSEKHVAFSNTAAYRGFIPSALVKAAGFKTQLMDQPACCVDLGKVRGGSAICVEIDVYRISRSISSWYPGELVRSGTRTLT